MATLTRAASSFPATVFTSPGNAYASDNVYATASPAKNGNSTQAYGGFFAAGDIPDGATISSVIITLEDKWSTAGTTYTNSASVDLGATTGTFTATQNSSATEGTRTYDVTSLRPGGGSWNAADFDANFEVNVRAARGNTNTASTYSLDQVTVTVTYTWTGTATVTATTPAPVLNASGKQSTVGTASATTPAPALNASGNAPLPPGTFRRRSGTLSFLSTDSSKTVDLSADPIAQITRAVLFATVRSGASGATPAEEWVSHQITNVNTLTFARNGGASVITVEWTLIEFASGVNVQRGSLSTNSTAIPFQSQAVLGTAVDPTKTFALLSYRNSGSIFGTDDFYSATLDANNLYVESEEGSGASNGVLEYQVVTYDNCSVQRQSEVFLTGTSQSVALATQIDPAKSLLLITYRSTAPTPSAGQVAWRAKLDATGQNVVFTRGVDDLTYSYAVAFEVVTFTDATVVRSGSTTIASGSTTGTATVSPAVDQTASVYVDGGIYQKYGSTPYSSDDNLGLAGAGVTLNAAGDTLSFTRGDSLAAATHDWQVVQFATGGSSSFTATAALSTPAPSASASGKQTTTATAAASTPAPSASASGKQVHTATVAATTPAPSASASGVESTVGTAGFTMTAPLAAASGIQITTGTAAFVFGQPNANAQGAHYVGVLTKTPTGAGTPLQGYSGWANGTDATFVQTSNDLYCYTLSDQATINKQDWFGFYVAGDIPNGMTVAKVELVVETHMQNPNTNGSTFPFYGRLQSTAGSTGLLGSVTQGSADSTQVIDITNARPGGGAWTDTDLQNLRVSCEPTVTSAVTGTFLGWYVDYLAVRVSYNGSLSFTATVTASTPAPSLNASGYQITVGTVTASTPAPSANATGIQITTVTASASTPAPVLNAAGKESTVGTAAATTPAPVLNAAGKEIHTGTAAFTFGQPNMSATGIQVTTGTAGFTQPAASSNASGTHSAPSTITGSASFTQPAPSLNASGKQVHTATVATSTPAPSTSATAVQVIVGTASGSLPAASANVVAVQVVIATASPSQPAASLNASGTANPPTPPAVTGTVALSAPAPSLNASAVYIVPGPPGDYFHAGRVVLKAYLFMAPTLTQWNRPKAVIASTSNVGATLATPLRKGNVLSKEVFNGRW